MQLINLIMTKSGMIKYWKNTAEKNTR